MTQTIRKTAAAFGVLSNGFTGTFVTTMIVGALDRFAPKGMKAPDDGQRKYQRRELRTFLASTVLPMIPGLVAEERKEIKRAVDEAVLRIHGGDQELLKKARFGEIDELKRLAQILETEAPLYSGLAVGKDDALPLVDAPPGAGRPDQRVGHAD